MAGEVLSITIAELQAGLVGAGQPTLDEVSVTLDGRRLDSKEAVLAWCSEVESDIVAVRHAELGTGTS